VDGLGALEVDDNAERFALDAGPEVLGSSDEDDTVVRCEFPEE